MSVVTTPSLNSVQLKTMYLWRVAWQALAGAAIVTLMGIGGWSLFGPRPVEPLPPPPPGRPGTLVPDLVKLEPGLRIGSKIPATWTDRLICTRVSIDSGDLDKLPEQARNTASRIRTAMLAEVGRTSGPDAFYHLKRVGVGLTLEHKGENTVVSPDSVDRLEIPMSFVDRFVLGRSQEAVERGRLAARTSTFALYDASIEFVEEPSPEHRSMFLRHALLVDPRTGRIRELVWRMAEKPEDRQAPAAVAEVSTPLDFVCGIHVKALTIGGKIPVGWLFAMTELPPGKPIALSPETSKKLLGEPVSHEESESLERLLRGILESHDGNEPGWSTPVATGVLNQDSPAATRAQSSPSSPSL